MVQANGYRAKVTTVRCVCHSLLQTENLFILLTQCMCVFRMTSTIKSDCASVQH
jgi:hypothetical protein